jgi:hypothetical protein
MSELAEVEPLWYLAPLYNRNFDVTSTVDDTLHNVATDLVYPAKEATTAWFGDWIAFVCREIYLHDVDAVDINYWEYADVCYSRYFDVCSCDRFFERKSYR